MTTVVVKVPKKEHPAKFSSTIQTALTKLMWQEQLTLGRPLRVLDPFAGVGTIHHIVPEGAVAAAVEIEPEWAQGHPRTIVGDATSLPFCDRSFDALCVSPTYGNRMADSYDGRDGSRRSSYRLALGRMPSEGSSASMQWGQAYRDLHRKAWTEAARVLRPESLVLVNVSNHIRKGTEVPVVEWHLATLVALGISLQDVLNIETPRFRLGVNSEKRVSHEKILVMRTAA